MQFFRKRAKKMAKKMFKKGQKWAKYLKIWETMYKILKYFEKGARNARDYCMR